MQHYFLEKMGIESWCLRKTPAYPTFLGYRLQGKNKAGVLLADIEVEDPAEIKLLEAIANATGCQTELFSVTDLTELRSHMQVAVLLGPNSAKSWCEMALPLRTAQTVNGCWVIVSHAPKLLLATKALKAEVWQDLQLAMQRLHEHT